MIAPGGNGHGNGKAGGEPGPLVPQKHGGSIWQGRPANVVPGKGRPPSRVKAALRESFDARIPLLEQIADGDAVQQIDVPLVEILKHAACPSCENPLAATDPATLFLVSVKGKISAHPKERLRAIETMGRLSDLESAKLDSDLIEELGDAVMAEVDDPEVVARIRERWVVIGARRIAGS